MFMALGLQMSKITPEKRKWAIFRHRDPIAAPLKNENFENAFFHVTRGPKIGIEPNFHDHRTSNVKDYPGKPRMGNF